MVNVGILDSEAKCWQESMFGGSSTRNKLLPWEELLGGKKKKQIILVEHWLWKAHKASLIHGHYGSTMNN